MVSSRPVNDILDKIMTYLQVFIAELGHWPFKRMSG